MTGEYVLWLDLETTGLDEDRDQILEVGALLTTWFPKCEMIRSTGSTIVRCPHWRTWASAKVIAMHEASGLAFALDGKPNPSLPADLAIEPTFELAEIDRTIAENIPEGTLLAGSSVGFDRRFIRAQMPLLESRLHYRNFDVRTLQIHAEALGFKSEVPDPKVAHRAYSDAVHAFDRYREIRDCTMVLA